MTGASRTDGLWAAAAAEPGRVTVLLSSFSASRPAAHDLDVALTHVPWAGSAVATIRWIDAAHASAEAADQIAVDAGHVRVALPAQSVAFLELRPAA